MPDPHFPSTPATGLPPSGSRVAAPGTHDADGFALGCECADPALQIERWDPVTAAPAATQGEPH